MAAAKKDDLKAKFEAAAVAAKKTKKKPDNATLLKLYSYYKQATEGDVKGERPGGFDFVGVGALHDRFPVRRQLAEFADHVFDFGNAVAGDCRQHCQNSIPPITQMSDDERHHKERYRHSHNGKRYSGDRAAYY